MRRRRRVGDTHSQEQPGGFGSFVVELVGEDDLTVMLSHRLVISRMNSTGYWEG